MNFVKLFLLLLNVVNHFQIVFFETIVPPEEINVGTVLFSYSDTSRKCWSNEQLALLRAREVYQDVLPQSNIINVKDDTFLIALINYFRLAVAKVKNMTYGKTKQINLMALTDTIGGYLRSIILPITKRAFYDGDVNYKITENLIELYEEIKNYLHTDGKNWARPRNPRFKRASECRPLPNLLEGNAVEPCRGLVYTTCQNTTTTFAMPFFDSKTDPTSIAMPFKSCPLRNLDSKNAVFVLVKYYLTVLKCLGQLKADRQSVIDFNKKYEMFIDEQVIPKLKDEKIYTAFGSVYRIKESINLAITGQSVPTTETQSIEEDELGGTEAKSTQILLTCLGIVAAIWLLITLLYCILKTRKKHRKRKKHYTLFGGQKTSKHKKGKKKKQIFYSSGSTNTRQGSKMQPSDTSKGLNAKCPKCLRGQRSDSVSSRIWQKMTPNTPSKKDVRLCICDGRNQKNVSKSTVPTHFMFSMPNMFNKSPAKVIKSAPVSGKNATLLAQENRNTPSSVSTTTSDDKPIVFGYDFETSTSESSSLDDSSAESTPRHAVKFKH